jgi:hypothetical protein
VLEKKGQKIDRTSLGVIGMEAGYVDNGNQRRERTKRGGRKRKKEKKKKRTRA